MSIHPKYRQLKAFTLAVATGSFKAAADRLAVTQPSFSALIKELEQDLGVRLFERSARGSVLTAAGQAFHADVAGALEHLETAYRYMQELGQGVRGMLSLAALPSLAAGLVTRKLARFRCQYPGVRIRMAERKNSDLLEAVVRGDAEIGVGSLLQPDSRLQFQPLLRDRMVFLVPQGHPLEDMRPVWKSAEPFDLILMRAGPTEHALRQSSVRRPPAFEVEHLSTAVAMVRDGLGISILPASVAAVLNLQGLRCLPIEGHLAQRQLGLVTRRGVSLSMPARAFAELLAMPDAPAPVPAGDEALAISRARPHPSQDLR